ncbi:hypothetical protein EX895_001638 [Sporisorium graminicola]|uniref:CFEM domain-containing protein n=1 Tax=Sporisorium graminicola TaxID=280036 RepID=A0A4U7KXW9_9BASI|nr:hypothetical protein EX895_001638 [Sporisorium graminicola]TKY89107.1 hypothetical protein EX895_001638 [Sporisorium graminicola]
MVSIQRSKPSIALFLLLVLVAAASVSAGDASSGASSAPQLLEAPPNTASPAGDSADDGGSISAPSSGNDAEAILASTSSMMGTSDDSTDGDNDDSKGASSSGKQGKNGGGGGHHGQCVVQCATKSTDGVGCGSDLSMPDCFCKNQDFIGQTFACINATCPQQFHGAAGVITSICSVAGAPGLQIPGYNNTGNLENMPTINADPKHNGTNGTAATGTAGTADPGSAAPPSGSEIGGGVTSTFSMPVGVQTPSSGAATTGNNKGSTGSTGSTSGAVRINEEAVGAMIAFSVVVVAASVGGWTLI